MISFNNLWIFNWALFIFFQYSNCLEVDLLNTATATSNLEGWTINTYVNGLKSKSTLYGWKEISLNHANITHRGFRICPNYQNTFLQLKIRSWLFSRFIPVEDASHIYVELKFWMRECNDFQETLCRETFKVYYQFVGNSSGTNSSLNYKLYTTIDTIAAESKYNPNDDPKTQTINTEVVSFSLSNLVMPLNKKVQNGIYVAVVDEGACIALSSIRIYYKVCPAITSHLAHFPRAITGPHKTSLMEVAGKCVDDSSLVSSHFVENQTTPLFHCTSSGMWKVRTGQCLCDPGFQADDEHLYCVKCSLNSYKSKIGNDKCTPCPPNSFTDATGATSCRCANLDYRFEGVNLTQNCDQCASLPSPPLKLAVINEVPLSNTIYLKWFPPVHNGHCKNIQYCIICQSCIDISFDLSDEFSAVDLQGLNPNRLVNCNESQVLENSFDLTANDLNCNRLSYLPKRCKNHHTFATIRNLNPALTYKFTVVATNLVTTSRFSEFSSWSRTSERFRSGSNETLRNFRLIGQLNKLVSSCGVSLVYQSPSYPPSPVANLSVVERRSNQTLIRWSGPYKGGGKFLKYQVRWSLANDFSSRNSTLNLIVNGTSTFLPGIEPGKQYYITVRAFNLAGYGNFCKPLSLQLDSSDLLPLTTAPSSSYSPRQSVYIAVAPLALALLIISCVLIIYWRKILTCSKVISTLHPPQERSNVRTGETDVSSDAHRTYVDPFHLRAMQPKFDCETDPDHVTNMSVIGCGEFGEVYRGTLIKKDLSDQGNDMIIDVAVKQLRAQCEPHEQFDFLREATALSRFRHPNVVALEAVVTESRPFMIVTELMKHGCLAAFIKRHGQAGLAFPPLILVRMLRGVASGMEYLSRLNYVHRDLAARNVLVNDELVCKVADFGLTRSLDDNYQCLDDVSTSGPCGKIAIRWTAPEAIAYGAYSQASDVWSFGVLAWEITTYGEKPYWNLTNKQVFQAVSDGFRLPASEDCPALLHQIMLECWHCERHDRPSFTQLVAKFDHVISFPDVLCELAGPASTGADELSSAGAVKRSCSSIVERSRDCDEMPKSDMENAAAGATQPADALVSSTKDVLLSRSDSEHFESSHCLGADLTETSSLLDHPDNKAMQYTQTSC